MKVMCLECLTFKCIDTWISYAWTIEFIMRYGSYVLGISEIYMHSYMNVIYKNLPKWQDMSCIHYYLRNSYISCYVHYRCMIWVWNPLYWAHCENDCLCGTLCMYESVIKVWSQWMVSLLFHHDFNCTKMVHVQRPCFVNLT